MSGFITNTGENFLLDLVCRAQRAPESYWIALIASQQPTKFTSGTEVDEPDVAEYSRIEYKNYSGAWTERSGEMSNALEVSSVVVSGNEVWPTLRHWGIMDASSGGNLLWAGSFANPIVLHTGDQIVFAPGDITLRTAAYMSRVSLI